MISLQNSIPPCDFVSDLFFPKKDVSNSTFKNGDHLENRIIKELINRTKASCEQIYDLLVDERLKESVELALHCEQLSNEIGYPGKGALEAHAKRYNQKYQITIEVILGTLDRSNTIDTNFEKFLEIQIQDLTPRFLGIIFDGFVGAHVVPMILKIDSTGPKILILDVLSANSPNRCLTKVRETLKKMGIFTRGCKDITQFDLFSCRVGSLVILRNALLDLLQDKSAANVFDLPLDLTDLETSFLYPEWSLFHLPPKWGFTNQIFKPIHSIDDLLNPRQLANSEKAEKVQTIQESRKQFNFSLDFRYSLTIPLSNLTSIFNPQKMKLPEQIEVVKDFKNDQMIIQWKQTKEVNCYMLYKGRKMMGRIIYVS